MLTKVSICCFVLALAVIVKASSQTDAFGGFQNELKYIVSLDDSHLPEHGQKIIMSKEDGSQYECVLPTTRLPQQDDTSKEATVFVQSDPAKLLRPMHTKCFYIVKDYWTYEVCPGKHVSQFHDENRIRSPEFSLGLFDAEQGLKLSETDGNYREQYINGSSDRRTELVYICGVSEGIASVLENVPLQYTIQLSTPAICDASKPRSVEQILAVLADKCLYRKESWWTFEFCYGRHIKQFHQEKQGEQIVQTSEFMLGYYNQAANEELVRAKNTIISKEFTVESVRSPFRQKTYRQIYSNGTACDVTTGKRRAEVRFQCPPTPEESQTLLTSVEEISTCNYRLTVSCPLLCSHPELAVPTEESFSHTIKCRRKQDGQSGVVVL
eukprot:GILK01004254.1.p1 GENE.GILK01004254.1~~GILK01004254.1.p1  ORF type:complete len:382 (-),score=51.63 GILK01004254.1:129-1274(-)